MNNDILIKVGADISAFSSAMKTAAGDIKTLGSNMKDVGKSVSTTGKTLSKAVTLPLVGIGAAALKVGAEFESGMSKVQAISGASGSDLEALTKKARDMGATTQFSASEAADALSFMAMAGWKTNDMLDGIDGVMNLAAASGEDLAMVSDIVTDSLTAFGLTAADSGKFADILAAASSNANTNVSMLGESFKYVAPLAGAMGYSAEDVSVALGLMANAGIKGSQAGTSLKTMLTNLAKPTKQMQGAMDQLGISLTDSNGNMKSLDTVMQELRTAFSGLSESQQAQYAATLFGKESMAGALAVINTSTSDYNKLSEAISNSEGIAAKMAATMNDNLLGRLKAMKSALEEVALSIYSAMQPALEAGVAAIQRLADWFNNLSPSVVQTIVVIGAIVAAIGPFLVIAGTLISALGTVFGAFSTVSAAIAVATTGVAAATPAIGALAAGFTLLTGPIGIAIAAIVAIGAALVVAYNKVDWFRAGVDKVWQLIKQATVAAFNAIKSTITTIIASAVKFGSDQLDKFKSFWDANGAAIMSIVKGHFNNVKAIITAVMGAIKAIFTTVWPILSNVVLVAWNLIKTTVSVAISAVLGTIQTVMRLLQGDWKGAWSTIKKTASEIWSSIESFFKNVSLVEIGKDIIRGLANGIGAMGNVVKDAALSIAKNIKDAITGFFGIKSPSRVMMGVGGFLGEGLAIGMKSELANVKRMAKTLARAASIDADASFAVAGYQAPSRSSIRTASVGATLSGEGKSGITVTQTLHFHDHALSPAEAARKQKQAAQQLALQWQTR